MTRCAIYTRVSSQQQAGEDKTSLQTQLQDCLQLASEKDLEIVAELEDIKTGTDRKRPAFRKLIAMIEAEEIDAVVSWREDRLYRGFAVVPFYEAIVERPDFQVFLVGDTFDRSMMTIKAGMAQHELETTRQRVDAGWRARMRKGKSPPGDKLVYGYRKDDDERPEVDPESARRVRAIFRMYAEGSSPREIMAWLQVDGSQRKWARTSLIRVVNERTYVDGFKEYRRGKELFTIDYPKLINNALWIAAQDRLERNRKRYRGHNLHIPALAAGLVRCKVHNRAMHPKLKKRASGNEYRFYKCDFHDDRTLVGKHPNCASSIRTETLDSQVWTELFAIVTNPARLLEEVSIAAAELEGSVQEGLEDKRDKLVKQTDDLETERQQIIRVFRQGSLTTDDLDFQLDEITLNQQAVTRKLEEAKAALKAQMQPEEIRLAAEQLVLSKDWRAVTEGGYMPLYADLERQQKLVKKFLRNIEVSTEGGEKHLQLHWNVVLPLPDLSDVLVTDA